MKSNKPSFIVVLHSDDATKKTVRKLQRQLKSTLGINVAVVAIGRDDAFQVNQVR